MRRTLVTLGYLALAAPALYQVVLLAIAIAGRLTYPYDLEWMEGGMLHHAQRLADGHSLYSPPSVDFIPYLYTPFYPALLATLGGAFGITYTLGRALSVISLAGIAALAATSIAGPRYQHALRGFAWVGVAIALGLFAAIYPFVEGWYDLVRADTLFLAMVTAGIVALPRWAAYQGKGGNARVAAGAAILALAFFCKQTGIFYVAFGGAVVLVVRWRRLPVFVAVAGVIGLGGSAAANAVTNGWFWTYVSKIHRAHDFNMDRFWKSLPNILWHFPALTIVVAVALAVVGATYARTRELPRDAQPLLLWSAAFAVSTVVGAVGWGTEFAHFNAYMPAFLHGALAAGAALPALVACAPAWTGRRRAAIVLPGVAAVALGVTLVRARWEPQRFVPTAADVAAGDKLIARIAALPGEVWIPSHPWYAVLAGKHAYVHRMGIKDVTTRQTRTVEGLDAALRTHAFGALVLDDRDLNLELPQIAANYRPAFALPNDERPHVYTGAQVLPTTIWLPSVPAKPPENAHVVFDFEAPTWAGWTRSGAAWGDGPATQALPGQGLVLGATGARFATSMHGGDAATGRVTSPAFTLDGTRLQLMLGGGTDATKLRVELWIDNAIARTASVPGLGGDALQSVTLDLTGLTGKTATLVLVDDAPTGHLDVDDVWLWTGP